MLFRSISHGINPFLPDKNHIHHRLMALGLSQFATMVTLILFNGMLISLNVALSFYVGTTVMLCVDIVIWIALTFLIEAGIKYRNLRNSNEQEMV